MSSTPRADGGSDGDQWEQAGRRAAAMTLQTARHDAEDALEDLATDTMCRGDDPTPEQVRQARRSLNELRRVLEEYVAPAAGCEPWGQPVPDVPYYRLREIVGCSDSGDREETDE